MIRGKRNRILLSFLIGLSVFLTSGSKIGAGEDTGDKNSLAWIENELKDLENISRIQHKITLYRPKIDQNLANEIATSVYEHCKLADEDPDLILAIMSVESWFRPKAKSPAGARGLMQVMPFWEEDCGDLWNIDTNIMCGIKIYQQYEKMFKRTDLALTAYNRGPVAVRRDRREGRDPRTNYAWTIIKRYKQLRKVDFDTMRLALL